MIVQLFIQTFQLITHKNPLKCLTLQDDDTKY